MGNSTWSGDGWYLCEHHGFEQLARLVADPDSFRNGFGDGIDIVSTHGTFVGRRYINGGRRFEPDPWEPYEEAWAEADAHGLIARRPPDPLQVLLDNLYEIIPPTRQSRGDNIVPGSEHS